MAAVIGSGVGTGPKTSQWDLILGLLVGELGTNLFSFDLELLEMSPVRRWDQERTISKQRSSLVVGTDTFLTSPVHMRMGWPVI